MNQHGVSLYRPGHGRCHPRNVGYVQPLMTMSSLSVVQILLRKSSFLWLGRHSGLLIFSLLRRPCSRLRWCLVGVWKSRSCLLKSAASLRAALKWTGVVVVFVCRRHNIKATRGQYQDSRAEIFIAPSDIAKAREGAAVCQENSLALTPRITFKYHSETSVLRASAPYFAFSVCCCQHMQWTHMPYWDDLMALAGAKLMKRLADGISSTFANL